VLPDIGVLYRQMENGSRSVLVEDEMQYLMGDLAEELDGDPIVVKAVEALLHRIGKAVVAGHNELLEAFAAGEDSASWEPDSNLWLAAQWLTEIGDLSREELESAKAEMTGKYAPVCLQIALKAQAIVAQDLIGKMMVKMSQDDRRTRMRFNSHPLIGCLMTWLSHKNNQDWGGQVVQKNVRSFLVFMSRRLTVRTSDWPVDAIKSNVRLNVTSPERTREAFRIATARAFVYCMSKDDGDGLGANMVKIGLVEAVPELVAAIWGPTFFPGHGGEGDARYFGLMRLVQEPRPDTTVEDLEKVMPLPTAFYLKHFAVFCQLWPTWRDVRLVAAAALS